VDTTVVVLDRVFPELLPLEEAPLLEVFLDMGIILTIANYNFFLLKRDHGFPLSMALLDPQI